MKDLQDLKNSEMARGSMAPDVDRNEKVTPGGSSLKNTYTKVYAPSIRALLGTTSHLCEVVVLKLIAPAGSGFQK